MINTIKIINKSKNKELSIKSKEWILFLLVYENKLINNK